MVKNRKDKVHTFFHELPRDSQMAVLHFINILNEKAGDRLEVLRRDVFPYFTDGIARLYASENGFAEGVLANAYDESAATRNLFKQIRRWLRDSRLEIPWVIQRGGFKLNDSMSLKTILTAERNGGRQRRAAEVAGCRRIMKDGEPAGTMSLPLAPSLTVPWIIDSILETFLYWRRYPLSETLLRHPIQYHGHLHVPEFDPPTLEDCASYSDWLRRFKDARKLFNDQADTYFEKQRRRAKKKRPDEETEKRVAERRGMDVSIPFPGAKLREYS